MNLVNSIALMLSGGVIVGSILLSNIGFERSVLTRKGAAIFSGVGVGLGCGVFIFCGIGNGDLIGSVSVGIIAATAAGGTVFLTLGKWQ